MSKNIALFEHHTDYVSFTESEEFDVPNVSYCEDNDEVHYNPWTYAENYLTFIAKESGSFTFTPQDNNIISYSKNSGETWTEGNTVEVNSGDEVLWKGTMTPVESGGVGTFTSTAEFDAQGNVMSLLFGDDYKGQKSLAGKDYAFYKLFFQNAKLINAKDISLPATTLSESCYRNMFNECSGLVTTPDELPATTLASYCYMNMFKATSITSTPKLPATTLASNCYRAMFSTCANLTKPPELPATTLAENCYYAMFTTCTSLKKSPKLPATTMVDSCYYGMFYGCTSLATVPELPATTLASYCYYCMFYQCSSITVVPKLPAMTLASHCYHFMFAYSPNITTVTELPALNLVDGCYDRMFRTCGKLNYVKAMFITDPSSKAYTPNWLYGVSSSGTFVKNVNATWTERSEHGIPKNWTVETANP